MYDPHQTSLLEAHACRKVLPHRGCQNVSTKHNLTMGCCTHFYLKSDAAYAAGWWTYAPDFSFLPVVQHAAHSLHVRLHKCLSVACCHDLSSRAVMIWLSRRLKCPCRSWGISNLPALSWLCIVLASIDILKQLSGLACT